MNRFGKMCAVGVHKSAFVFKDLRILSKLLSTTTFSYCQFKYEKAQLQIRHLQQGIELTP